MGAETVGDRLRRFRRLRRLSQEALAEKAGVRQNYIAQLERGATTVPRDPDNLKLLAAALGVRLRDLAEPTGWYADEGPTADPLASAEAVILSSDLPEDRKQAALVVLRDLFAGARRSA